jgi:hypothetical protein
MRGHYYGGQDNTQSPYATATTNAAGENSQPQVIPSPDTVSLPEDVRAIVAHAAHTSLQKELHWSFKLLQYTYPALVGLTREQIENAIREALA